MRRGLTWMTTALATAALAVAFGFRPPPLPAAPAPIRLDGEIVTGPPPPSLVIMPPPTIWLGETIDPSETESVDTSDDLDSGNLDDTSADTPDDSPDDSPDD